jgi:hypothetical protein
LIITLVSRQSSVLIHPLVMELDPKSIPANGLLLMLLSSLEYRRQLEIWGVGAAEGPIGNGDDGGGGGKGAGRGTGSIAAGAEGGGIGAVRSLSKQRHCIKEEDVNGWCNNNDDDDDDDNNNNNKSWDKRVRTRDLTTLNNSNLAYEAFLGRFLERDPLAH